MIPWKEYSELAFELEFIVKILEVIRNYNFLGLRLENIFEVFEFKYFQKELSFFNNNWESGWALVWELKLFIGRVEELFVIDDTLT